MEGSIGNKKRRRRKYMRVLERKGERRNQEGYKGGCKHAIRLRMTQERDTRRRRHEGKQN